jgi:hypothetical protein
MYVQHDTESSSHNLYTSLAILTDRRPKRVFYGDLTSSVTIGYFYPDFKQIWNSPTDFHMSPIQNFMFGAGLIHVDRQTKSRANQHPDKISVEESALGAIYSRNGNNKTYLIARYFWQILTKFLFSRQILIKVLNIKFHGNLSNGRRADKYGQTDRHDAGYRSFFCDKANVANNRELTL